MNFYVLLVYAFFYRLYISIIFYTKYALGQIKPAKKVEPLDYDKKYQKYIKHYNESSHDEANSNIVADLYDFDKRKVIFAYDKNEVERIWRTRLLYEFTERGNVLMFYNPYKLTFEYYSDAQIIPYKILQYIAKKYVSMNRCRDFYIDMVEKPDNKMLDVLRKEEDALKSKTMKVNDITKLVNKELQNKDNVFESLKEHRVPIKDKGVDKGGKAVDKGVNKADKGGVKEKPIEFTNKYTRLGKISDFNIIQKQPKKSIAQTNALLFSSKPIHKLTDFFDDLDIDDVENPFVIDGLDAQNGLTTPNGLATPNGLTNGSDEPTPLHTRPAKSQREQDETDLIGPPPTEKISSYKMFKMMKSQELC